MKKNLNILKIICVFFITQQFMSCKKDTSSGKSINTNSHDNSIHNLPVDTSLVLWLTFKDGSLKDKSGLHNDVQFASATPAAGKHGLDSTAYFFDGASKNYMTVKSNPSLSPAASITLAALVKPMGFYKGQCHSNRIMNKQMDDNSHGRYALSFDDMKYYNYNGCDQPVKENRENLGGAYGDGRSATGTRDTDYIKAGNWYNVVFTYDGSVSNLYINNKLAKSSKGSTTFNPNSVDLYIGKTPDKNFPYYFNGVIDEIRIYNRALSANEVINLDNVMGKDN